MKSARAAVVGGLAGCVAATAVVAVWIAIEIVLAVRRNGTFQ